MDDFQESKQEVLADLKALRKAIVANEQRFQALFEDLHPDNLINAKNLLHYLTLRTIDIRDLQDKLHSLGLSSLSISESHILGQINAILRFWLQKIDHEHHICTYEYSKISVQEKIAGLFGIKDSKDQRHIMVTIDGKWSDNYEKFESLLKAGMNIARINCAHDDEKIWIRMIENIKIASYSTGKPCKIYVDLAGPKIRTILKDKEPLPVSIGGKIFLASKPEFKKLKKKKTIGCIVENLTSQLKTGEHVYFDDGLIKSVVIEVKSNYAILEIISIASKKPRIKHEKGINFPDTLLHFPALTSFDKECLPFIADHADMVGYSFVKDKRDIELLREAFQGMKIPAIILKVENTQAVYNLPSLLFECMKEEFSGVMIARGDLAVEIGFEKLSEIQEEILWICEAAHIPVIWATQVLENLNKKGTATRSEITDAAMSSGADCVMLNKGDNIVKAVKTLKNIFRRMGDHHYKKRFLFRPLKIAIQFIK